MKKATKKAIEYDETNIPGGSCMSGKGMTKKEAIEMAKWVEADKAKNKTTKTEKVFS